MKLCNRKFLFLALFIGIAVAFAACSKTESFASVNTNKDGFALEGFDAVAYFAVDKAVEGNKTYEFAWNGAKWLFSNAENLEKFS